VIGARSFSSNGIDELRCGFTVRLPAGDAERVAVRPCLRNRGHADIASSACAVLDHQALPELGGDQRLERTDHRIGAATGREGYDDLDQLLRVGGFARLQRQHGESHGRQHGQNAAPCNVKHVPLLVTF